MNEQRQFAGVDSAPEAWAREWLGRIAPKFRPVWEGRPAAEQRALGMYFLPHRTVKEQVGPTRPRVVKWYCPFADQALFPSGHRYCINVYTGCSHRCVYCYASGYLSMTPATKKNFVRLLGKDLADLEDFDVPPAPVHLSNSTDPLQALELRQGDTKAALEGLLEHRARFSSVTLVTKNPALAAREDYLSLLRDLGRLPAGHPAEERMAAAGQPPMQVEASLAFWREEAARFWDPGAPGVASRMEGIRALREAGIPVVLRIDPLLPRSGGGISLPEFGLVEPHGLGDLDKLVGFAAEAGLRHIVYSTCKVVRPRGHPLPEPMAALLEVFRELSAPGKPVWRGGSWRLPEEVAHARIVRPFLELCARHGVRAKFCMENLLGTV